MQETFLFSVTIRENIAYGRPDATLDEVIAAAKAAQAHDFISAMPEGYDTEVGERGVTLSGGQKQRIAIARALLLDPRILILDDATASVDTETEHEIQQALRTLMAGRTTLRDRPADLRPCRRPTRSWCSNDGQIVERGTHIELIQRDGFYRELYELQLQVRDEAAPLAADGDPEGRD